MSREFFIKDTDYATEDTAGVVKVGEGLSVSNEGVLSVSGGGQGRAPYIYMTSEDYLALNNFETDAVYWVINTDGTHGILKNNVCVEGTFKPITTTWKQIQKTVRNNWASKIYSIGDQLSVNYNGSAVMFDIVAFDLATPADSNYTHSMTLIPHDCLESLMFDNKEPSNSNSDRRNNGNNRYLYSNIRKWLNSNGEAGNWWTAQHSADAAPDYADTKAGFMSYFDSDFLSVIGKTKIKVVKNTKTDGGGYEEISDDYFYLPSRTEVGLGLENDIFEGISFPYFNRNEKRIKYYSGSTTKWWLRTPLLNYAYHVRNVHTSGEVYNNNAYEVCGIAPACNII